MSCPKRLLEYHPCRSLRHGAAKLCRNELSPAERAQQTARRKAIYLELHPETAQHVAGGKANGTMAKSAAVTGFAASTAAATGSAERTVRLDAERGEKVIDEVMNLIRGTKLDTGTYLDRIKNLSSNNLPMATEAGSKSQTLRLE